MAAPTVTPDIMRDYIKRRESILDRDLGMTILRLVHATHASTPNVILSLGRGKPPSIDLNLLEDEMVVRIWGMVKTHEERLCGGAST